jgi:hypothetical protein
MENINKLIVQETDDTPSILFDIENNTYSIVGISVPENSHKIYDPVITWINDVLGNVKPTAELITLEINLKYFSTTSAKYLLKIITAFSNMCLYHKVKLTVNWYYHEEDEDMHDAGDLLHKLSGIDFSFKHYVD